MSEGHEENGPTALRRPAHSFFSQALIPVTRITTGSNTDFRQITE